MKTSIYTLALVLTAVSASTGDADIVAGADPLFPGDSVDGWSAITVLDTPFVATPGNIVDTWSFYADPSRAHPSHYVTPLVVKKSPAGATIVGVGGEIQVNESGVNTHPFNLQLGTNIYDPLSGDTYHAGIWQRNEGVDNIDGGVVAFGASGGSGVHLWDEDGTTYVPALGSLGASQHQSSPGGRNYAFNFQNTTAIPEPSMFALWAITTALGGFIIACRRWRASATSVRDEKTILPRSVSMRHGCLGPPEQ